MWPTVSPCLRKAIITNKANRALKAAKREKRLPKQESKRRELKFWKNSRMVEKRELRVKRKLDTHDPTRVPLTSLAATTDSIVGQVISLTQFGSYIDVNSTIDGLLHLRDMSADAFVSDPSDVVRPGDEINVYVKYMEPATITNKGKLAFTLIEPSTRTFSTQASKDTSLLPLDAFDLSDEVWGTITRVTLYGAFVDVGARVPAFLHFMDHTDFPLHAGTPIQEWIPVDKRVRVWVKELDLDRERIKVTGVRPTDLPVFGRD